MRSEPPASQSFAAVLLVQLGGRRYGLPLAQVQRVLPDILSRRAPERRLRIWSAGCSTGEEPFTIAILLQELAVLTMWDVLLVGTDVNRESLRKARAATYPAWSFRTSPEDWRATYFEPCGSGWRLIEPIRGMVRFAWSNLGGEPLVPPSNEFDLIVCRNVTIYFDAQATQRLYRTLLDALAPGGWLILGHSDPLPADRTHLDRIDLPQTVLWRRRAEAPVPRPLGRSTHPPPPPKIGGRGTGGGGLTPAADTAFRKGAPPAPTPAADAAQPSSPSAAAPPDAERASVRVAVSKLDTLLTESGELSVTHLRVAQRLAELRSLQRQMERLQREWLKSRAVRARLKRTQSGSQAQRERDTLLRLADSGESQLQHLLASTSSLVDTLAANTAQLGAVANAISQEVMAIRLLPAGTIFMPLERLVRDLCRQTGKQARLELSGTDTEIDRRILDELRDPLLHMVRNSIDHAIEPPAERLATSKPATGSVRLSATQVGDRVQIAIEDDGRGLNPDVLRATAVQRGLLSQDRAESLETAAVTDLIFQPGFSTRTSVSEISGRGVGMDVVREHVERLGGTIRVRSTPGAGTCFTITVPLTLATTRVLLVEDAGQMLAVPSSAIQRTGRMRPSQLQRLEGCLALPVDGRSLPVVELRAALGRASAEAPSTDDWRPYFVLASGERAVVLLTDHLIDEQELVVKPLGAPLGARPPRERGSRARHRRRGGHPQSGRPGQDGARPARSWSRPATGVTREQRDGGCAPTPRPSRRRLGHDPHP